MNRTLNLKELGLLHTIEKCGGEITKKELYEITVPQRSGRDAYTTALRGLILAGAVEVSKQRHASDSGRFACQTVRLTAGR